MSNRRVSEMSDAELRQLVTGITLTSDGDWIEPIVRRFFDEKGYDVGDDDALALIGELRCGATAAGLLALARASRHRSWDM